MSAAETIAALADRVAYLESVNAALKAAAEERVVLLQELVRENADLRQDLRHNAAMLARQCDRAMEVEAAMLAGLQNNLVVSGDRLPEKEKL